MDDDRPCFIVVFIKQNYKKKLVSLCNLHNFYLLIWRVSRFIKHSSESCWRDKPYHSRYWGSLCEGTGRQADGEGVGWVWVGGEIGYVGDLGGFCEYSHP